MAGSTPHVAHLPAHPLDAEIDDHFAEVEVEEFHRHGLVFSGVFLQFHQDNRLPGRVARGAAVVFPRRQPFRIAGRTHPGHLTNGRK